MTVPTESTVDGVESKAARRLPDDTRPHIVAGLATVLLLVGGLGGWAATTELSGAVIGAGTVVVDSNVKKVQHPVGGIVGEINVREGMRVNVGDILIRLDQTVTRANLGVIMSQIYELEVRQARLQAERDGTSELKLSASLVKAIASAELQNSITSERRHLQNRRTSREGMKAQLEERLRQLSQQVLGLDVQRTAKEKELELVQIELQEIEKLWQRNLAPLSKRIQLNREATRIDGENGQLISSVAQAKARIAETHLQIVQLDNDLQTEVSKELREVQAKLAELNERRIAAEDQLRRVDLKAPQSGYVHVLSAHTVGGVIGPGEQVMQIVPLDEALVIEVKISPQDVAQVKIGQDAIVRFTSFNARTTPEIKGKVVRLSADITREQQQPERGYFTARIAFEPSAVALLGEQRLQPGLPADVYIQTERRTALSYIIKPLADQTARAFKER